METDMIKRIAENSYRDNIEYGKHTGKKAINEIAIEAYELNSKLDQIRFLNIINDTVIDNYNQHLIECRDPESCTRNSNYELLSFYLRQELEKLGITVNEDTFTQEEKSVAEDKLDIILKKLEKLELGQQFIYDDLHKEIEELRELFFLGKKKWHQLLAGKVFEMTVSGVVSESISKEVIEVIKPTFKHLIENINP